MVYRRDSKDIVGRSGEIVSIDVFDRSVDGVLTTFIDI